MTRTKTHVVMALLLAGTSGCPRPPTAADAGLDWKVQAPFNAPADQLAGTALVSCPTLDVQRCVSGTLQRCAITDTATGVVATSPDPLYQRVLTFERWYDLFHSPDGLTEERQFTQPMPAGTPEAQWSGPAVFQRYGGGGDSAIWTGVALNADIMRYLVTGAPADYQRMEDKVRALLTLYEVTGVPGYLARYHLLMLPPEAPVSDRHIYEHGVDGGVGAPNPTYHLTEAPGAVQGFSADYLSPVTDGDGGSWMPVPMWVGNPSIDQYSGSTVSLPAAYGLLKDEALKQRVASQLTCYLKRLQRLEIRNVQKSADVVAAMQSLLGSGTDIDLSQIDHLIVYYLPQLNSKSAPTFDRSCPAAITLTPGRVLDAATNSFEGDLLTLIGDLSSGGSVERPHAIDHYYIPNVRGADAVHLMNLAAMGSYFTGDPQYAQFMNDELISTLKAPEVARTISLGKPNKWCRKFYDSHISIPPLWAFTNLLGPSTLRTQMEDVLWKDAWLGDGLPLGNPKFGVMAASHAPPGVDPSDAVALSMREISHMGGNGGLLLDPRRSYTLAYDTVADAGLPTECPSEAQRAACEQGPTIFGIQLQGQKITRACTGASGECPLDGGCASTMSAVPLPAELRQFSDFIWQRSPFEMGNTFNPEARAQSPSLDVIEEYWLARYYGYTHAGEGQALAWQSEGTCP